MDLYGREGSGVGAFPYVSILSCGAIAFTKAYPAELSLADAEHEFRPTRASSTEAGSSTLVPSIETPPLLISRRASDFEGAKPTWAIRSASAPPARRKPENRHLLGLLPLLKDPGEVAPGLLSRLRE